MTNILIALKYWLRYWTAVGTFKILVYLELFDGSILQAHTSNILIQNDKENLLKTGKVFRLSLNADIF